MKEQHLLVQDLLERIVMIEEFTAEGKTDFLSSRKTQESVIRCFEVIGEIVKRLDPALIAKHSHVPWRRYAGFRDILIHSYDKIEITVVWDSIENDLPVLKTAILTLLADNDQNDSSEMPQ